MRLEDELKAMGCDMDADTFRDSLADLFAETNRNCTVENLLCRWRDAGHFCALARYRLRLPETADELILRTLLNIRKQGELSLDERAA